jgi:alkylation response protein AidB-like acyl-CoA dehydrogenase
MDFDLSEEQRIFQRVIRDFAEKEIAPLVERAEEEERFPLELFPKMGRLG